MRTIKELLELMLHNKRLFFTGLCNWASNINMSYDEYQLLKDYIKKNRPSMFSSFDAFINCKNKFYWEQGNITPRIEWIKKHIKLN